jgi:hypothetical protein
MVLLYEKKDLRELLKNVFRFGKNSLIDFFKSRDVNSIDGVIKA